MIFLLRVFSFRSLLRAPQQALAAANPNLAARAGNGNVLFALRRARRLNGGTLAV